LNYQLPSGWTWATPGEIIANTPNALTIGPFGSDLKVPDYRDEGVPLVFVREIRAGRFGDTRTKFVDAAKAAKLARHYVHPGDLLITKMGEPPGDTAVYPEDRPPAIVTADCIKLTPNAELTSAAFLRDCLRAEPVKSAILEQTAGVAQQKLSLERFRTIRIPLPPLEEQRRIVAKLEALQSRSRRARKALDAVPLLLERLRQSILAAAFRGDLTKDWRAQNPNPEPVTTLLARIRTERRKQWEASERAKFQAQGKAPPDDSWKAKYKEPEPVNTLGLPDLPEGWCWVSLECLTDAQRGIPYGIVLTGDPVEGGVPTVRCGDIKSFEIDVDGLKRVSPTVAQEFDRTRLTGGEVLIAIRGTVGATAIVTADMAGMNISREVAMIPTLDGLLPRYLMFCLAGPEAQARVMKHVKGVAQAGINLADLRTLPVPMAPLSEQIAVLGQIEDHLATCTSLVHACRVASDSSTALDRSVLARAFRGELVAQDPNNDPADVMVSRLRADSPSQFRERPKRAKAAE
jgi:type I restriction enzyme, S subunit